MIPYHVRRNLQGLGAMRSSIMTSIRDKLAAAKVKEAQRQEREAQYTPAKDTVTVERPVPEKTPQAEPIQQPPGLLHSGHVCHHLQHKMQVEEWRARQPKEESVTSTTKTAGTETVQSPDEAPPGSYAPVAPTQQKSGINPLLLAGGAVAALGALFMLNK